MATDVFERQAPRYDDVARSALGRALRTRVHRVVEPLVRADSSVLDLGCGTGIDAAWLASRVGSVLAVDPSPAMVGRAAERCGSLSNVTVRRGDVDAPNDLLAGSGPHDLVLANFGVVNCIDDWDRFGARLRDLLVAGGHAVIVTMPRWCPVELAVGIVSMNRSLLRRRVGRSDYEGRSVRYASARTFARHMAPALELVACESLGLALPPFEQRGLVENRPRLLATLAAADRALAGPGGWLGVGDHQIAVFRRAS